MIIFTTLFYCIILAAHFHTPSCFAGTTLTAPTALWLKTAGLSKSLACTPFLFLAVLLTLRIAPMYMQFMIVDVPPLLIRGSGCPVTGNMPTATPILKIAWVTSISASPMARKAGKLFSHRDAMVLVRNSRNM